MDKAGAAGMRLNSGRCCLARLGRPVADSHGCPLGGEQLGRGPADAGRTARHDRHLADESCSPWSIRRSRRGCGHLFSPSGDTVASWHDAGLEPLHQGTCHGGLPSASCVPFRRLIVLWLLVRLPGSANRLASHARLLSGWRRTGSLTAYTLSVLVSSRLPPGAERPVV